MSWTSSPREARSVATRIRTRPENQTSCPVIGIQSYNKHPFLLFHAPTACLLKTHFLKAGHVLSLKSWKASSRSRCSWPPCRHCTTSPCRVMSLARSSALAFWVSEDTECTTSKWLDYDASFSRGKLTHTIFLPTKMRTLSSGNMFLMKSSR